jgi:serine/threonine-protein kinase HipA
VGTVYIRRLVFLVLSGNHDAHLKNWALVYPDGLRAHLAPVYDFVATVAYSQFGPSPALRWLQPTEPTLDPEKPLVQTTTDDLLVADTGSGADTSRVLEEIEHVAAVIREAWSEIQSDAPARVRERVSAHLDAALLR